MSAVYWNHGHQNGIDGAESFTRTIQTCEAGSGKRYLPASTADTYKAGHGKG